MLVSGEDIDGDSHNHRSMIEVESTREVGKC